MPALAPFVVHVAGKPGPDHLQRCVPCGAVLLDNSGWYDGRVAVPDGQERGGPAWWPSGVLVATDKAPGQPGMTYTVDARPLADDERACT